jgi:hypothetical protein
MTIMQIVALLFLFYRALRVQPVPAPSRAIPPQLAVITPVLPTPPWSE